MKMSILISNAIGLWNICCGVLGDTMRLLQVHFFVMIFTSFLVVKFIVE